VSALRAVAAAALLAAGPLAHAADASPGKPMKMDEPMHGEMKKESMKKGDVKKAAEKKERDMKPAMDRESAGAVKK
jgi:Spy/CpxP family protein refolding chaperone